MSSAFQAPLRDTRRQLVSPVISGQGRLYLWFPDQASQAKVVVWLSRHGWRFQLADGNCVLVDAEWERLRELSLPLRRLLTHLESDDLRVLFKAGAGDLTTADFPRVHSFTQFSVVTQSTWLNELLTERRLTSVFQPIVEAAAPHRVFGREALLRGVTRQSAVLYPSYIFDVARGCGMLPQVDLAARQAAIDGVLRDGVGERVFINVSPAAVADPLATLDATMRMLALARIEPTRVVFEVVESDRLADVPAFRRALDTYREAGFRVALDDVGAGYSSLNLLHQLRPDFIKLDMELVRGVDADPVKGLIAQKIVEIATQLGIETIAEGIETPEELGWVQASGARYAQGHLIAKPNAPVLAA
jgi:EAL domain-containing protein (putative c-di-GMP-specific phosphodiesterase class I)